MNTNHKYSIIWEVYGMEIIETIINATVSIFVLYLLSRLIGNREISQLSMSDYINGITIGSIAAEMATSKFEGVLKPFVAMVVYAVIILIVSILTNKSIKIRRLITGTPVVLYDGGELYRENLKKAKMDLGEFLAECRVGGYFDISKVQTILLEPNGKFSFLPTSEERPLTCKDMNLKPEQDKLVANVIIDGKIMKQNLRYAGKDEKWLMNHLKTKGCNNVSDIFLATCDINNNLSIYKKINKKVKVNILE